jgi:hypothetical protein
MTEDPIAARTELIPPTQVRAIIPPVQPRRRGRLDRLLHKEDPERAAERKKQEAAFKGYFADQYKTVKDLFEARGIDMTDLAAEPKQVGEYTVQAVKDGFHTTRVTDKGNTEIMELTSSDSNEIVFSRAILKDDGARLDPGITYEHTGKFYIDEGTLKPSRNVKRFSSGKINISDFKSGVQGAALNLFVNAVRALPPFATGK